MAFWNSVIAAVLISQPSFDRYDVMFCVHGQHYSPKVLSSQAISSGTNRDTFTAEISCCCFHWISFKFGGLQILKPFQMSGTISSLVTSHINMSHDWTVSSRNNAVRGILEKHNSSVLSMKRVLSHHSDHMSESTVLCVKTAVTSAYFIPHFV